MNNVSLMGRFTRDPELRQTPNGVSVASFTLAVDRGYVKDGDRQTDFIDCVAWRQTGEFINKYFVKGQMIAITGSLTTRTYQDKNGNNRKAVEVNVNQAYFCESKKTAASTQDVPLTEFEPMDNDDGDLPF